VAGAAFSKPIVAPARVAFSVAPPAPGPSETARGTARRRPCTADRRVVLFGRPRNVERAAVVEVVAQRVGIAGEHVALLVSARLCLTNTVQHPAFLAERPTAY
jgi:hypothetical protein